MADDKTVEASVPHVVIVGAGFGGLEAARGLADAPVRITIVDQRNHHLFQPLLYQVATATLATSEIAWPVRHLVRRQKNVTTLLGSVVGVNTQAKQVLLDGEEPIAFDTLILATGARHAYFGHDEWEPYAPGLKTLEDATKIRRRILAAFEQAEWETDPAERAKFLTFVIIGAGPTGVELAGTIAELARDTLRDEFRNFDTRSARVVLIEAGPRILSSFSEDLSDYAQRALTRLGVEVKLGHAVSKCGEGGVELGGDFLPAKTIIWAAGVAASPAAE
ncbi:MAG TPA: FAD-dependent oxidoreductase, partial [Afipia sp.]|nr:FAD-dependent oxidoreductase [Afipia sp.]